MTKKTVSPFAGLDTSLLRSTQTAAEGSSESTARAGVEKPAGRESIRAFVPVAERPDVVTTVQQALRATGKEIYYVRVTPTERQRVDDLIHTFKQDGLRTSVNEVGRIALNHLLEDFDRNGAESVIARVLEGKRA